LRDWATLCFEPVAFLFSSFATLLGVIFFFGRVFSFYKTYLKIIFLSLSDSLSLFFVFLIREEDSVIGTT